MGWATVMGFCVPQNRDCRLYAHRLSAKNSPACLLTVNKHHKSLRFALSVFCFSAVVVLPLIKVPNWSKNIPYKILLGNLSALIFHLYMQLSCNAWYRSFYCWHLYSFDCLELNVSFIYYGTMIREMIPQKLYLHCCFQGF